MPFDNIEACFPEEAPTRQAAREMSLPTLVVTPIGKLNIGVTTSVRVGSYKRLGRFAPTRAVLLPNAPADLKSWLFDRLGAIEWLKIEESEAPKEAAPQPAPAAPPRLLRCAEYAPELAALYRLATEREPKPFRLAPVIPEIVRWRPPSPPRRPVLRVVAMEAAE